MTLSYPMDVDTNRNAPSPPEYPRTQLLQKIEDKEKD